MIERRADQYIEVDVEIRADLTEPARLTPDDWAWVVSPQPGVERVMLDRVGDEVAVATSFVRYAPRSRFPGHDHALGEEFVVLDGEFGDEHGRYPPGTYVRNPPGSHHVPFSDPGCLIWVKLRQFYADDLTQLTRALDSPLPASGVEQRSLHQFRDERVAEIVAAAGEPISMPALEVAQEILVLEGALDCGDAALPRWGWLRAPPGRGIELRTAAPSRLLWKARPAV